MNMKNGATTLAHCLVAFHNVKYTVTWDPAIPFLHIYLKEMKTLSTQEFANEYS